MRKPLRIVLYLVAALLVGPIFWAALVAIINPSWRPGGPEDGHDDAWRLVRTFDEAFPQSTPMHVADNQYDFR